MAKQEKPVVSPKEALAQASRALHAAETVVEQAQAETAPVPTPKAAGPQWRFEKLYGIGDKVPLADGTVFEFPLKRSNDGGCWSWSFIVTGDEKLAKNLRAAAEKNPALGIKEVKI